MPPELSSSNTFENKCFAVANLHNQVVQIVSQKLEVFEHCRLFFQTDLGFQKLSQFLSGRIFEHSDPSAFIRVNSVQLFRIFFGNLVNRRQLFC